MTRDEAKQLVALAVANFPTLQAKDMRPTAVLWQKMLADIPYAVAEKALLKVLATCRHFPTVADIREAAAQISQPQLPSPAEAWAEVYSEMERCGIYRAPKFSHPAIEKTVRALGWYDMNTSEEIGVVRAQFMRIYEQLAKRESEQAVLPEPVRNFIARAADKLPELP